MNRIIIFTGKGGVGKTSTASAHAVKAAKQGMKTLIVSTDLAHNLSDIFMQEIKKEPTEIIENLWGLEIDPNYEMENYYGSIKEAVRKMMIFGEEKDEETYEDIVAFPGMEELFCLLKIKDIYEKNIYDLIIVDSAPTGETLSLLKFPELLSWYMEKFLPIGKVALKFLRPISKIAFKVEMPNKQAINDMEKLYIMLSQLQLLLKNREVCSIRLVTIPEKMVVEETKRNYMYLNLYNFNVDGLYINRIIPKDVNNSFFDEWKKLQKQYMDEIESVFFNIPIINIKWYEVDINGIEGLNRIVKDSLNIKNIFEVQKITVSEKFEKTKDGYKLEVYVPFGDKNALDLYETGTDISISIGNFKRNIPCPNTLKKYSISKAKFNNDYLAIYFMEKVVK
ncbi:ArsA family ATPase [Clostridium grantii]|uniref:arsenite-transporting ATPase n=1 Tax=Clostridium grantii DSM 8605 TaxID=1121316 RepID=A0A1M5VMG8_9CLOT|nr:ArsA family ATPase [Clostridium grantii]SHH76368.1 arsenite-transporting ATPase [Clostridium grantii DSM 8605]